MTGIDHIAPNANANVSTVTTRETATLGQRRSAR
jgi:hypothetical protein